MKRGRGPEGPLPRWVCKPDPVWDDHPSRLPTKGAGPAFAWLPAAYLDLTGPGHRSCLALHRTGFAWPPRHRDAGALLPHLFTFACSRLTCGRAIGRVFLWHFPAGCPGWALPTVLALGCPDFPRGVFSPPAIVRPTPGMIRGSDHPQGKPPLTIEPGQTVRNTPMTRPTSSASVVRIGSISSFSGWSRR